MASGEILAVIPARGGSKGLPRKNILRLAGKPLIAWTIEAARQAKRVNRVVVSTEDGEIAAVAESYGAEVILRPAELATDTALSEDALLQVLQHLQEKESYHPELLVFLQCTSPLTTADDIDGTVQALLEAQADCALSVTPFHHFLWRKDEQQGAAGINHDWRRRCPRQQLPCEYLESGAVYVLRTEGFKQAKHRFFGKIALYVTPPERVLEIDSSEDFRLAQFLIEASHREAKIKSLPESISALVLDFDGVLTDNRVLVHQDGTEAVVCHRGDGWGLEQLKKWGLPIIVLSKEANPVVSARCKKLGIECIQGLEDKLTALKKWLEKNKIPPENMIYVGNDVNDLPCMDFVGCAAAPADADRAAREAADIVLTQAGGAGAVREICDLIMARLRGKTGGAKGAK